MVLENQIIDEPSSFTLLSGIVAEPTEWLWWPRIPLGELSVIDGDPATNKSLLTLDLAARVTTGREMPDGASSCAGGVVLLVAEDSLGKTVRPRLEAANADLARIAIPNGVISVPNALAVIEHAAQQVEAKLIVIDPITAFLRNSNSDQSVRQALTPLRDLAERTNAAILIVRHLNKSGGQHSLYRGSGSIGLIAATRSALLAAHDPRDPKDHNLRVLCHVKNNLGPRAPGLSYEPMTAENGNVMIEWRGEIDYRPEDLLAPPKDRNRRLHDAQAFLLKILADGPIEQQKVKTMATDVGFAWRTIERAKEVLEIVSRRQGWGPGSKCVWEIDADGA